MMGVKTMSLLMALLLVTSSFAKPAQSPEPVKVEGGLLQGTVEDGLTIYRGIPYAAPPVGRSSVAGSSARAKMARRARGERVWPRMHAVESGNLQFACPIGGLSLSQCLDACEARE